MTERPNSLRWFSRLVWLGILFNLAFALPAMFAPDMLSTIIGTGTIEFSYIWVANAGMLLVQITLFSIPAAYRPERYAPHAWLVVFTQLALAVFWVWQVMRDALGSPFYPFILVYGALGVLLFILLQKGMPEEGKLNGANFRRFYCESEGFKNNFLHWYTGIIFFGLLVNAVFIFPSMFAPGLMKAVIPVGSLEFTYVWLAYAGATLLCATLFYIPAGLCPERYHVYGWLAVAGRAMACTFWLWQVEHWNPDTPVRTYFIPDGLMGLLTLIFLQIGLPPQYKINIDNVLRYIGSLVRILLEMFHSPLRKAVAAVAAVLIISVGSVLWYYMGRSLPDTVYDSLEDQYKYGAIGLSMEYRVPYYIFMILPELCPDLLPEPNGGWKSFGVLFEEGKELPVGFAKRHIGYPSVEPNCAACHTGGFRKSTEDLEKIILGGPAHELDLQKLQWFLYDSATDPRFTPKAVADKIQEKFGISWLEAQVYRYVIVPFMVSSLKQQQVEYAWQKSRPEQGRGRTDTFNPTKFNVFRMPYDDTIGTVDLPAIWNQRSRVGLNLHWDGNNDSITERNFAAAMAIGSTPYSVLPSHFKMVTDYVLQLPPPEFPFDIDTEKAERGWKVFKQNCASCHEFGTQGVGTVTPIEEIGTDPHRLHSFTAELVEHFHSIDEPPFVFNSYHKTHGYSNLPIDGTWARAPYLHNGSVPTLWHLLQKEEDRPKQFYRGYNVYDPVNMGFIHDGIASEPGVFLQDSSQPGNGNEGHEYGVDLSDAEKWDLIEYLKTM